MFSTSTSTSLNHQRHQASRFSRTFLAAAIVVSSLASSNAPAIAASFSNGSCINTETALGHVQTLYLPSSNDATFEGNLDTGLVFEWVMGATVPGGTSLLLAMAFYEVDSSCLNGSGDFVPEGICFTFAATGWSPVLGDTSQVIDSTQVPSLTSPFVDNDGNPLSVGQSYSMNDYPGSYYFLSWSDDPTSTATGPAEFSVTFTNQNANGTCTSGVTAPSENWDIDIDHYRNRAAAEAGALPNTL